MGSKKWFEKNLGDSLPIIYKESGHPIGGFILILGGSIFGILLGWGLIEEMLDIGFEPAQLGILVVVLPGFAAFIAGFFLFYKVVLSINSNTVNYEKKRLFFKNIAWSERLSEYDGILMEKTDHSQRGSGSSGQSYITYELTLRHANNRKHNVLLYTSRKPTGFREQSEKFSRLCNKPIFRNAGEGKFEVREVDQLDKQAAELVREGKVEVNFNENRAFEFKNIMVTRKGEVLDISMLMRTGRAVPFFFFLVAGLVLCLPLVIEHEAAKKMLSFGLVASFGGVFGMIGVVVFLLTQVKEVLTVAPDRIKIRHVIMGKTFSKQSIPASQIEEVSIYQEKNKSMKQLHIAGDQGSIRVGQTLTDEEIEWIKNSILSTIR